MKTWFPHAARRLVAVASALSTACLAAAPARAQVAHVDDNDWRQGDRHDALLAASTLQKFEVEIRFAPYQPDIDSAFSGKQTPFNSVFGVDCSAGGTPPAVKPGSVSARLYFGAEFDYLPIRIPFVGAVGPAVSWGYTSFSNQTIFNGGPMTGQCSAETTTLTIMPMYGAVVLRADELMRRTGVPLVPYGKFGVGLAWWRASTDAGTETYCATKNLVTKGPNDGSCSSPVNGDGLTPSLHFAVGLSLSLNFIDTGASARLSETTGVKHAYIFGELWSDKLTIATDVLHVGTTTYVLGLAADL
jgi:hypothetical protein